MRYGSLKSFLTNYGKAFSVETKWYPALALPLLVITGVAAVAADRILAPRHAKQPQIAQRLPLNRDIESNNGEELMASNPLDLQTTMRGIRHQKKEVQFVIPTSTSESLASKEVDEEMENASKLASVEESRLNDLEKKLERIQEARDDVLLKTTRTATLYQQSEHSDETVPITAEVGKGWGTPDARYNGTHNDASTSYSRYSSSSVRNQKDSWRGTIDHLDRIFGQVTSASSVIPTDGHDYVLKRWAAVVERLFNAEVDLNPDAEAVL